MLFSGAHSRPAPPAGAARSAVDALLSDDAPVPRAPAAPAAFAVFAGADGTVYTLARAPGVSADDRAFGRVPASRYLATGGAAAASSSKSAPSSASKAPPTALPEAPAAAEAKKKADAPAAAAAIPGRKIAKAKRSTAAAATAAAEPSAPAPAPAAAADKAVPGAALLYPDGVVSELARPHGATKCILRAYSLSGGGASAAADAGGVSALAPLRLKSESAKTLWVPPVAADCQLGAVALPDWAAAPPAPITANAAQSPNQIISERLEPLEGSCKGVRERNTAFDFGNRTSRGNVVRARARACELSARALRGHVVVRTRRGRQGEAAQGDAPARGAAASRPCARRPLARLPLAGRAAGRPASRVRGGADGGGRAAGAWSGRERPNPPSPRRAVPSVRCPASTTARRRAPAAGASWLAGTSRHCWRERPCWATAPPRRACLFR